MSNLSLRLAVFAYSSIICYICAAQEQPSGLAAGSADKSIREAVMRASTSENNIDELIGMFMANTNGSYAPKRSFTKFNDQLCIDAKNTDAKKNTQACGNERNLYILHVSDWAESDVPPGKVSIKHAGWYLFRFQDNKYLSLDAKDDTFPDLYDFDNGMLISVSILSANVCSNMPMAPDLTNDVTTTEKQPTWLAGLTALISGLAGPTIASPDKATPPAANKCGVQHSVIVKARLLSLTNLHRPFDISITQTAIGAKKGKGDCFLLTKNSTCQFKSTFSVNQREYVTFGVGIVPYGPRETTYTTATDGLGTVTPSTTRHNPFYGMVDFTPMPVRLPMNKYPYLQAGLPFSGAATHLPYFGVAVPTHVFAKELATSVFGGVVILKQAIAPGKEDRAIRLNWGVEVPLTSFSSAVNKVTGDKKK